MSLTCLCMCFSAPNQVSSNGPMGWIANSRLDGQDEEQSRDHFQSLKGHTYKGTIQV
jgi:hypothetical protein